MRIKWTDKFLKVAESNGLNCQILHLENGWIETLIVNGKRCYAKSITYNLNKKEYYTGVDPKKLHQKGDLVIICGGDSNGHFRDIFLIPWKYFFNTLRVGEPQNTYRLPKVYMQYRFYLRDRNIKWVMSVQPAGSRELDITQWRYSVDGALVALK